MRRVNELKILILTAATGGGHLRAAHTLQTYIQENTQGNEVVVADTLKEVSTILDKTCCDGYRFMATGARRACSGGCTAPQTAIRRSTRSWSGSTARSGASLLPLLEAEKPDVVISTHPFATEMVSHLKGRGRVRAPLLCLMTDYGPHRACGGAECGRLCRGG